jgi:hypothetical protein
MSASISYKDHDEWLSDGSVKDFAAMMEIVARVAGRTAIAKYMADEVKSWFPGRNLNLDPLAGTGVDRWDVAVTMRDAALLLWKRGEWSKYGLDLLDGAIERLTTRLMESRGPQ